MKAESLTVEVAVVEGFELVFDLPRGSPGPAMPWELLDRAVVEAHPHDTLRMVMRSACRRLGIELTPSVREAERSWRSEQGVHSAEPDAADVLAISDFWRPGDDELVEAHETPMLRRTMRPHATVLVVRDEQGRAVWRRPGLEATMAELVDAADAGLLEGDPLRPYLIPLIPQGDPGAMGAWIDFASSLRVLWEVTEAAATIGGAAAFAEMLRTVASRRSKAAVEVVERRAPEWADRGAVPGDFFAWVISKPRSSDELAALMGCSPREADAILWSFGMVYDERAGVWRYGGDLAARLLGDDIEMSFFDLFDAPGGEDRLKRFAADRLERLVATGEVESTETARERIYRLRDDWLDGLAAAGERRSIRCRATDLVRAVLQRQRRR